MTPYPLPPHQARVATELDQLQTRIASLLSFLNGDLFPLLPTAERVLLKSQKTFMDAYAETLSTRIALWRSQHPHPPPSDA